MKLFKKYILQQRILLLLLIFVSNSGNVFSANSGIPIPGDLENEQQLQNPELGEQVNDLFDPILPVQKSLVFFNEVPGVGCNFNSYILSHTTSSLNYLKRSRYLLPALGVREVIYPFHVFL